MKELVAEYIKNINKHYKLGNATEHTYHGDLQCLIEKIVPQVMATNEPKRRACGAPDYVITKKKIPVGFIEAKDIDSRIDRLFYELHSLTYDEIKIVEGAV